jgi:hypothetical protein
MRIVRGLQPSTLLKCYSRRALIYMLELRLIYMYERLKVTVSAGVVGP